MGETSLIQFRDLPYEEYCLELGSQPPIKYLCKDCLAKTIDEYGYCEDCGDSILFDIDYLKSVMEEDGLYCPKHKRKRDKECLPFYDEEDQEGIQDAFEYMFKDM